MSPSVSDRVAAGPRVLVLAERGDREADEYLGVNAPALCEAGYRLRFAAVPDGGMYGLVHVHGWGPCSKAWGLLGAMPSLVSLHGRADERMFAGLGGQLRRWLTGRALARADAVVVPGEDERAALLRLFPNMSARRERVVVMAGGVSVERAASLLRTPLAENLPTAGERRGVSPPVQAPPACLRAARPFATISDTNGVPSKLAAHSTGGMVAEALSRLERYGGVPPFIVTTPDDCDLFIAASRADRAAAMRALCAGVPVLGCVALRETLADTPARLFGPSAAELESALREALCDLWTGEAIDYAPTARERFDNRHHARRLIHLYDRLTAAVEARAA